MKVRISKSSTIEVIEASYCKVDKNILYLGVPLSNNKYTPSALGLRYNVKLDLIEEKINNVHIVEHASFISLWEKP